MESSGSVVECLTGITALYSWARHINHSLVLVQPRKTCPCITERLLMGHKESKQTNKIGYNKKKKIFCSLNSFAYYSLAHVKIWNAKIQLAMMQCSQDVTKCWFYNSLLELEFSRWNMEKPTFCHWEHDPISVIKMGKKNRVLIWNVMSIFYTDACILYSKTCVKRHSKVDKTKILMTNGSLMTVESIAECSQ